MVFPVSQKRIATLCFLGAPSSMTAPSPSACGGGAGGGLSDDVLSATLLEFDLEDWRAMPFASVEGKGGTAVVSFRRPFEAVVELLRGRVGDRLESLENGEMPCALDRMRSIYEGELESCFIDVETRESFVSWKRIDGGCRWMGRGGRMEVEIGREVQEGGGGRPKYWEASSWRCFGALDKPAPGLQGSQRPQL